MHVPVQRSRAPGIRCAVLAAAIAFGLTPQSIATAASSCQMIRVAELPVRTAHGKLVVDGAINGQPVGVMLDTGASHTVLFRSAAVRLGLERRQAGGYGGYGVGGETTIETGLIDEFRLGQATRKGWRMMIMGEHDPGDDVAALLGEDFFDQFDVEFDLAHNAVRLFQPKDCSGVSLAYWAPRDADVTDMAEVYSATPQILLTVMINGQSVRAMLDSGAGTSILDKSVAARLGVTPETPGTVAAGHAAGIGTKSVDIWRGSFKSFVIGDEMINDTLIDFGDVWRDAQYTPPGSHLPRRVEGASELLLGADFLRSHRLLVAHSQNKIYFSYTGGPVFIRPPPQPQAKCANADCDK